MSTDDPLCFGNRLTDEYTALAAEAGFTRAERRPGRPQWLGSGADVPAGIVKNQAVAEIDRLLKA